MLSIGTAADLADQVARAATGLAELGVGPGDRVAGDLPNRCEAVVAMLAASAIGAVWSSCSPDFGNEGVVDRFGQTEPKVLIAASLRSASSARATRSEGLR